MCNIINGNEKRNGEKNEEAWKKKWKKSRRKIFNISKICNDENMANNNEMTINGNDVMAYYSIVWLLCNINIVICHVAAM